MKILISRFKNWCNLYSGVFTFLAFIVAVISIVPDNKFDFGPTKTFLKGALHIAKYPVQIPLYLIVCTMLTVVLYFFRLKKRYKVKSIAASVLKGTWRNEWATSDNKVDTETITIGEDFKYRFLDGRHFFDLKNIKIDAFNRQIEFTKVAVRPGDNRQFNNKLSIVNNDLLSGIEGEHKIRYIRVQD